MKREKRVSKEIERMKKGDERESQKDNNSMRDKCKGKGERVLEKVLNNIRKIRY